MKKVKNQVVIQARLGSTRLPGKVLLPLAGLPVLAHVVNRCRCALKVERVVVATTDLPQDDQIEQWCHENEVALVRGSSDDVLARYMLAIDLFPCQNVVRVTADCPLTDPAILDAMLFLHELQDADYTSNVVPSTFPAGFDAEVVKCDSLKRVDSIAKMQSHREHVTLYIRENTSQFKVANLEYCSDFEHFRLTLDRPEDYEVLKLVFNHFSNCAQPVSLYQVLGFLNENQEIVKINAATDRFEGARKSAEQENRSLKL